MQINLESIDADFLVGAVDIEIETPLMVTRRRMPPEPWTSVEWTASEAITFDGSRVESFTRSLEINSCDVQGKSRYVLYVVNSPDDIAELTLVHPVDVDAQTALRSDFPMQAVAPSVEFEGTRLHVSGIRQDPPGLRCWIGVETVEGASALVEVPNLEVGEIELPEEIAEQVHWIHVWLSAGINSRLYSNFTAT